MDYEEIDNKQQFLANQFGDFKEMEMWLNSLYNEWRFVDVVNINGCEIIAKVTSRKNTMKLTKN